MTEAEAKTKWCPFARVVQWSPDGHSFPRNRVVEQDAGSINVLAANLTGAQCIGSACMAWRQSSVGMQYEPHGREKPHGFCGLAGKP